MNVYATPSDVAARWRPLTSDQEAVAAVLIEDASSMIRSRWPQVDARLAAGTLTDADVTRVVAGMVKRAMLNGAAEGVESQSQTAGPFAVTHRYANPSANLYFSAEDVRLFDGTPRRRAFAVDLCQAPAADY